MRSCLIHSIFLLLLFCRNCHLHRDSSGRAMRQYNDLDDNDDSFIGLMGKRSFGPTAELPLKRDLSDVFVQLFGRRNADRPCWVESSQKRRSLQKALEQTAQS